MVSQKGYRKITVFENNLEREIDVPYLLKDEDYGVELSIVVPCYNETKRFPDTFKDTYKYLSDLKNREGTNIEMVLVNDGSRDATYFLFLCELLKMGYDKRLLHKV